MLVCNYAARDAVPSRRLPCAYSGSMLRRRASGAEGAQLRVLKRRISVVRDAAGRSSGPEWHSRARQASRRGECQLSNRPGRPDVEGNGDGDNEGGCDCVFTQDAWAGARIKMTSCNAAEATVQANKPAVAQSWRRILVVGGRWVLNAGRIIRLGRPPGSSRWLAWR
jgi:hypothetical protein